MEMSFQDSCDSCSISFRKEMEQESQESWKDISIEEHMAIYENQGIARKEAMKMVAKDRGVTKREIYQALLVQK